MNIKLVINKTTIYCFLMIFFSACATTPQLTTNEAANQFVKAINQNDVQVLLRLSNSPFYVHNQKWESAKDGYGFVLGKRNQMIFKDNEKLSVYMNTLSKELKIDSVDGEYIPVAEYPRFHDDLGGFALEWESQDIFLFLRGMGDVEHIVILGVNRKTKKIKQLYFN